MQKFYNIFLFSFFLLVHIVGKSEPFDAVRQLAERRVPWLVPSLSLSAIPADNGSDVFELSTASGKLRIAASNANAAAMGLNWYLKYYCNRSMSHLGDNLSPVQTLPVIPHKIHIAAAYPIRYALNYCTINYTMSFYTWKQWERELDWMALNGVNLMLAPVGTEAVWQNTLRRLAFTDKEIVDFLPGPAFTAWWLLGNLEGWGGPVTQAMVDRQAALQKQILNRMKAFGIEPVLQGFYGIVPTSLKHKMEAKVSSQGMWAKAFTRPDVLLANQPAFGKIAAIYYDEIKRLYGNDLHYFGGDPFHEGGNREGIDVTAYATAIQTQMQQAFPGSTWVLQGWEGNPEKKLLDGINKANALVVDLFGETYSSWETSGGYEGFDFIMCNVSNFGERNGLYGRLQRIASEAWRARNGRYGKQLKGFGIIPEGINNNPLVYDLTMELPWHTDSINTRQWISGYSQYRYGSSDTTLQQAWQLLLASVYSSPTTYQFGAPESILCARPGLDIKKVTCCATPEKNYDTAAFAQAVKLFCSVAPKFKNCETYQTDKIDLLRQLLTNRADIAYDKLVTAIKTKTGIKEQGDNFMQLLQMQDSLLSQSPYFSLDTWLKAATDFGQTAAEKATALRNAKVQISYWGNGIDPLTGLNEYACKEWGGLLSSLYAKRWQLFIQDALDDQPGKTAPDYFKLEKEWANSADRYPVKKLTTKQYEHLTERIVK